MYVGTVKSVKKGKSYFSYLIRESYRENGKVKHRTISNISKLPADQILQIKKMLQGKKGSFNINPMFTTCHCNPLIFKGIQNFLRRK